MGASIKFNWVLQIEPPDAMKVDETYQFTKSNNRMFPIDTPIDLIDLNRTAIAKVKITSFTNRLGETFGYYTVVKIYADPEKSMLSNYWNENQ